MQYRFTKDFLGFKKGETALKQHEGFINDWSLIILLEAKIIEEVKDEEWPKVGDRVYRFTDYGEVYHANSTDDTVDRKIRSFLGNYHTKEEAEKARDDVREFIRNRNK